MVLFYFILTILAIPIAIFAYSFFREMLKDILKSRFVKRLKLKRKIAQEFKKRGIDYEFMKQEQWKEMIGHD